MAVVRTLNVYTDQGALNATIRPNYNEGGVNIFIEDDYAFIDLNIEDCKNLIKYLQFCIKDTNNE